MTRSVPCSLLYAAADLVAMSSAGTERCAKCGASLKTESDWCPQCLTPVERPEPERRFAPPDAFLGPRGRVSYSRVAKTDVSYGVVGRIAATVLLVVVPTAWLLFVAAPFALIWIVAACPLLIAGIWKRTPVREEEES